MSLTSVSLLVMFAVNTEYPVICGIHLHCIKHHSLTQAVTSHTPGHIHRVTQGQAHLVHPRLEHTILDIFLVPVTEGKEKEELHLFL